MKQILALAVRLTKKFANELDDTMPEGLPKVEETLDQDTYIQETLRKALRPFLGYIADNIVIENGKDYIVEVALMATPDYRYSHLENLSKGGFYSVLLDLIKALQTVFPESKVSLKENDFKGGDTLIKEVKVVIPFGASRF